MASETCDGCQRDVRIGGGGENLWTLEGNNTGGMTIELEDGEEYFLCFECLEELPETPTSADIQALPDRSDNKQQTADGGFQFLLAGIIFGVILGTAVWILFNNPEQWVPIGFASGFLIVLLFGRVFEFLRVGSS